MNRRSPEAKDDQRIGRAVKYLIDMGNYDAASLVMSANIETGVDEEWDEFSITESVFFTLRVGTHAFRTMSDPENPLKEQLKTAFNFAVSLDNESSDEEQHPRHYQAFVHMELDFKELGATNWRDEARALLNSMSPHSNQAIDYWNSGVIVWEDMRFRSTEELMIAKELDKVGVLFMPNCKARCGLNENRHSIEPDFVIFSEGRLGILEIDGTQHSGYAAKDHDKDRNLFLSGAKTVQRYSAKRCRDNPQEVVREFMQILNSRANGID